MFKELRVEGKLEFTLTVNTPLLIKSGDDGNLDPTVPDMSFVRTMRNGIPTVYMPGGSLKGVLRTRVEKLAAVSGRPACNPFDMRRDCNYLDKNLSGKALYDQSCIACKMFGSTRLAGRFSFMDAYPMDDSPVVMGIRHGVGIDRRTGAASGGAKYQYEVIESAKFHVTARFENEELRQLKLLLYAVQDITDGYVTFGMGGSRGLGRMEADGYTLTAKDYRKDTLSHLRGYDVNDLGKAVQYEDKGFFKQAQIKGLGDISAALACVEILQAG